MIKEITLTLCSFLFTLTLSAQESIESILLEIEQNNTELKAFASYLKSRKLEFKSENNLPDPQVGAYFLPWGDHNTGNYTEFEVSQSIVFPSLYGAKNKLIEARAVEADFDYEVKRQAILYVAQTQCLNLVHLGKQKVVEQERLDRSALVFEHAEGLYDKEEIGLLEFNKAKVSWLQTQFIVQELEMEQDNILLLLKNMNGGNDVVSNLANHQTGLKLSNRDSLWNSALTNDPNHRTVQQKEHIARQALKVSKSQSLPDLTLGYNYQGVEQANYSGIYGGLSIPIWSNRNKVIGAQAKLEYQTAHSTIYSSLARIEFDRQYNEYQTTLTKFNEYKETLSSIDSENMLLKAYQLGELSYLEYFIELMFYHQAFNTMLAMEKKLYQLKAQLLKHQL